MMLELRFSKWLLSRWAYLCVGCPSFSWRQSWNRALTAVAGVARPSVGISLSNQNNVVLLIFFPIIYFNEIGIFFTPFTIKLFFKIVLSLEERSCRFCGDREVWEAVFFAALVNISWSDRMASGIMGEDWQMTEACLITSLGCVTLGSLAFSISICK